MAESSPEGGGEAQAGVELIDVDKVDERHVPKLEAENATVFTKTEDGSYEKSDFEASSWKQTLEDHEENADVVGDAVDRYTGRERNEKMFDQMQELNGPDVQVTLAVSEEVAEDIEADGEEYDNVDAAWEEFSDGPTEEEAAEQTAEEFEFVGEKEEEAAEQTAADVEFDVEQEPAKVAYETESVEAGKLAAKIREDELSKEENRELRAAATLGQSSSDTVFVPGSPEKENEVVKGWETDDGFETEHEQNKEASNALPGNASLETSGNDQLKPGPLVKGVGATIAASNRAADILGLSQEAALDRGEKNKTSEELGRNDMGPLATQQKEKVEKMEQTAGRSRSQTTGGQNV